MENEIKAPDAPKAKKQKDALPSDEKISLDVPADAAWLYVLSTRASGDSMLPSSMEFSSEQ